MIDRSVDDVFAFVSDAENDRLWETGVEACVPDRNPGVGQQRDVHMKAFGRRYEGSAEVTEYDPERRLTIEITSGFPVTGRSTYEFEPVGENTRIDFSMAAEPVSRVLKRAQPVMRRMLQKQWESDLETLKELLEAETAAEASAN